MREVLLDTLLDCVKLIPFLFLTYLLLEFLEHKTKAQTTAIVQKAGAWGPFIGGLLGALPQCGFSASASGLYATRIISLGTLFSIYLSTSDEMLPIFLSEQANILLILKILAIKVVFGCCIGYLIDFLFRKKQKSEEKPDIHAVCEKEHCNCQNGILRSALHHTLHILLFVAIITLALNTLIYFVGEDALKQVLSHSTVLTVFLAALVGMIPNCAGSVVIAELFLSNTLTFGAMMAGLLTGSGVGLLILFRQNKSLKKCVFIAISLYFIGVITGLIFSIPVITQWIV